MHILVVNHCPPAAHNALLAWGFVRQALAAGERVSVFFDADGVMHAIAPEMLDAGMPELHAAYSQLLAASSGDDGHLRLMICRAALSRRSRLPLSAGWESSGLTELAECAGQADRSVSFSV